MKTKIWDALKSLGIPDFSKEWAERNPDYVTALHLSSENIPDLIAILELWGDKSFFERPGSKEGDEDEDNIEDEVDEEDEATRQILIMTPIHAWRILAQLGALEAVAPMLKMADGLDEAYDEWYLEEFPYVFQMIGPPALPALRSFLEDSSHGTFARVCVARGIFLIAEHHETVRPEAIGILRGVLSRYKENPIELNAFISDHLIDLHSVEDAELIERAFADECVDEGIFGTWKDARERLGVPGLGLAPDKPHPTIGLLPAMQKDFQEKLAAARTKAAKKRQAKSRKRNRKR